MLLAVLDAAAVLTSEAEAGSASVLATAPSTCFCGDSVAVGSSYLFSPGYCSDFFSSSSAAALAGTGVDSDFARIEA